jgi:hypothetical protein
MLENIPCAQKTSEITKMKAIIRGDGTIIINYLNGDRFV